MDFVIDKHNAEVARKGTLVVSAIVWAVVAARMVYWMRFLNFAVVGIVSIVDEGGCLSPGLIYLLLYSSKQIPFSTIPIII
jgi:hypothetical protein